MTFDILAAAEGVERVVTVPLFPAPAEWTLRDLVNELEESDWYPEKFRGVVCSRQQYRRWLDEARASANRWNTLPPTITHIYGVPLVVR